MKFEANITLGSTEAVQHRIMETLAPRGLLIPAGLEEYQNAPICERGGLLSYDNTQPAPCGWVRRVKEWGLTTDLASSLNYYVTDDGIHVLDNYRSGLPLSDEESEFITKLNAAIYQSPHPDSSFSVLRGIYMDPNYPLVPGTSIVNGICRSGSFDPGLVLQGYFNPDKENSVILRIHIPKHSILTWHPSEDQVIFPMGAEFLITSNKHRISMEAQWTPSDPVVSVTEDVIDAIYIDAPSIPETSPSPIPLQYETLPNVLSYITAKDQDYIFPYRIPQVLTSSYNGIIEWSIDMSGYTADCINGILHAIAATRVSTFRSLKLWNTMNNNNGGSQLVSYVSETRASVSSYQSQLQSGSNAYTIVFIDQSTVMVKDAPEFLRGFISVTQNLGLDYRRYIISLISRDGVLYTISP